MATFVRVFIPLPLLFLINDVQLSTVNAYIQVAPQKLANSFPRKMPSARVPWTIDQNYVEDWRWAFTSMPDAACTSYICDDIEGTVPQELKGTYYRNGPGKLERGGRRVQHVFDGNGFVSSINFQEDGRVQYTGRFVETEFFKKEEEKDEILFRNVFGTERSGGLLANAFDVNVKNAANTNVMQFGKRLFAFCETGEPYELHPQTLETLTTTDHSTSDDGHQLGPGVGLGAQNSVRGATIDNGGPIDKMANLGRYFTAHPHIVSDDKGDDLLVAFRAAKHAFDGSLRIEFLEYQQDWSIQRQHLYSIDNCCMAPHDFCVMNDYVGFFENRMELDSLSFILALKGAAQSMTQRLDLPSRLHLVPRRDDKKAIQVDVPPFFCVHTVSQGIERVDPVTGHTLLTIYSTGWDLQDPRLFPEQSKSKSRKGSVPFLGALSGPYPDFDAMPPSVLFRTVVDVDEEKVLEHGVAVSDLTLEFPQVDEKHPHVVYGPCSWIDKSSGRTTPLNGYCKIDTERDTIEYWWADNKMFTEELIPVPKQQQQLSGEKQQGSWLLGTVHDAERKRTSLVILDSEKLEQGPVGRIHLKYSLTCGLHASFASCL